MRSMMSTSKRVQLVVNTATHADSSIKSPTPPAIEQKVAP
jgi:hypothetical protein